MDEITEESPKVGPGKVIETFLVRVTLRLNEAGDDEAAAREAVPTNKQVTDVIETALYAYVDYFALGSINATAEKVA